MTVTRERDFYAWTRAQAEALREARARGSNLPLDWDGLVEEIEALGASEQSELTSNLARILEHLAKLAWSRATDPRRVWSLSVKEHRARVSIRLRKSPSLRRLLPELLADAWEIAPDGRPLPEHCPFTVEQVLDRHWLPPPPG